MADPQPLGVRLSGPKRVAVALMRWRASPRTWLQRWLRTRRRCRLFKPVVSSPPPYEPDVRLSPHPALHEQIGWFSPTRAACAGSEVPAPAPVRRPGSGAPVFTGDLLPSSRAAYSLDPFAMWPAFLPGRLCSLDYYGSSATPRRQQRTVRLPRTRNLVRRAPPGRFPRSPFIRSAGSAPSCTPGTSPRATATLPPGLARPSNKRAGETVPSEQRDRASRRAR